MKVLFAFAVLLASYSASAFADACANPNSSNSKIIPGFHISVQSKEALSTGYSNVQVQGQANGKTYIFTNELGSQPGPNLVELYGMPKTTVVDIGICCNYGVPAGPVINLGGFPTDSNGSYVSPCSIYYFVKY